MNLDMGDHLNQETIMYLPHGLLVAAQHYTYLYILRGSLLMTAHDLE